MAVSPPKPDTHIASETDRKHRKGLLLILAVLLLSICGVTALFGRYLWQPAPIPDLLPLPVKVVYPPHYLFSIYGVDKPVGVALSAKGDRIYVAETGGNRLTKIFDREGIWLDSFAPPGTEPGQRSPVYLSTGKDGHVFVTDRLQHAIFVYDELGMYLDTILGPDLTLSRHVAEQVSDFHPSDMFIYNVFEPEVQYQKIGDFGRLLPPPRPTKWSPLGVRVNQTGQLLVTDVNANRNTVRLLPSSSSKTSWWSTANTSAMVIGDGGSDNEQLLFPNIAVSDSQGRIYVTDSNNSRISMWSVDGRFLLNFAQGRDAGAISLPRGAAITRRDYLHVVDAVGHCVNVYDVSGSEPVFLFTFGEWGMDDSQFNYPNDIALDSTGRLYIADRENDRVQVWAY